MGLYGSYQSRVDNDHERLCSQVVCEFRSTHIHGFEQSELHVNIDSINFVNCNFLHVYPLHALMLVCFTILVIIIKPQFFIFNRS